MQPKLPPGQHLKELVQRACPARQHHHGVGVHEHDLLTLVHVLGDHQSVALGVGALEPHEVGWDHAEALAARSAVRLSHRAHDAAIARAEDQPPALVGERRAHFLRLSDENPGISGPCATKDTNGCGNSRHGNLSREWVLTPVSRVDIVDQPRLWGFSPWALGKHNE
ncbi:hypothetical protein AIOL_002430 [Candidatus Rhodobacter oscarellae]|uniref:Uncharacterized protein n=1 Tax=Candidatus Rhodobacter oscarellae TaxID=1675527 RepID=A0A0J9E3U8_9RHOB|nr:hypothetical protein AIOL_002430 [Candidatus Rhodobacter lobularis]